MKSEFETDFELYKIFYITAEAGSITATAKNLYISQPSVTKRIQKLEELLGCALFVRTKQGVRMTAEGQRLYEIVAPACRALLDAEKEIQAMNSLEQGEVSIASTEMSFKTYVLPAMERFKKKHPGIRIRFANALNETMENMLRMGRIDLAIMHEPFHLSEGLTARTIEIMKECMVCGKQFEELPGEPVPASKLTEYPIIAMPSGSSSHEYLNHFFGRLGLTVVPEIELTTVELMASAVERNLGVSTLPYPVARPLIEAGRILQISVQEPLPPRRACLITNSKVPQSAASRAFASEILKKS